MQETKELLISIIGCGYIGRKLLQLLLTRQVTRAENIITLVKSRESQQQCLASGVSSIQYDMDDINKPLPKTALISNSILYYFAPPPGQGTKDTRARQFLKQLSKQTPAKIVLISTTGVYGNCHGHWVDENTPVKPSADRARRRLDAEQQFRSFCQKFHIPLVILRVSGIYGPDKLPLERIRAHLPVVREEDSPFSNRIHTEDLLEICFKAGLINNIQGIFNCADGHPTTMCDYFMKVARANKLPEPPTISLEQAKTQLSAGMLSYMEESRRIDIKKLLSTFKLTLKYPDLAKGLARRD